jgi:hypothetical protein
MGLRIASTKISSLPISATDKEIGSQVRRQLTLCEFDLPNPVEPRSVQNNFLKAAGFKNAKESYNQARQVSIDERDGIITITPTINRGRSAFDGIGESVIKIASDCSDEILGNQIRLAWTLCEGADSMWIKL